jgi:hypothetical protein
MRQEELDNAARQVLGTPAGRRFLWWLLDDVCGLHSGTFTGTSETFYREGRRSVAIDVLKFVQRAAPDAYSLAVQEALSAAREAALHREDAEAQAPGDEDGRGQTE